MSRSERKEFVGIGYKLKLAQHALRMCMDDALRVLGLTTPQYAVLSQLELKPGISNAALARASFITAQTMHGIVSNLEKQGLLKRKQDASHGRILRTVLTKKGHDLVVRAHTVVAEAEDMMMSSMSQERKILLEKLLVECINNLNLAEMRKG